MSRIMHQFIHIAYFIGLLSLAWHITPGRAQDLEAIATSIREGSSKDLGRFFDQSVSLHLNNTQGDYSNNQAQLIMRDFFKNSPPHEFKIVKQGKSTDKIWYLIGEYRTGATLFKVLIKGTQEKEILSIYSIEFKRE